jgi:hypothetical protein
VSETHSLPSSRLVVLAVILPRVRSEGSPSRSAGSSSKTAPRTGCGAHPRLGDHQDAHLDQFLGYLAMPVPLARLRADL